MDDYPVDLIQQGAVEFVFTTHVTHQQQFFVHLESRSKILEDIMCKLEERYTDLKPADKPLLNKKVGSLCAVKFTDDNNWYRAKITGVIKNGLIEVHFVDYGNVDYVSEDRVKAIDPDLVMYPVQCYRCSLASVSCAQGFWTPELIIQFEDRVVDKKCRAVFMEENEKDEVYLLQMYDSQGTNINELFGGRGPKGVVPVQHKNGACQSGSFKEVSLQIGTVFQATVVYVNSPELFWCQDITFVNDILIMSEELSRLHMTQDIKPLTEVSRGTICAAKSSEDEAWYRSIVQATSDHTAQVNFVDYGNSETVSLDVLCNLKPEMRTLPALGIKCCLAGVEMAGRQWKQDLLDEFEQLVMDKEFEVKVVGKEGGIYVVTLLDIVENKDVRLQLQSVLNRHAQQWDINSNKHKSGAAPNPGPSIDVGSTVNVFLSWIENPGDFWVQHSESEELLEGLSQRLQDVYAQQQPLARPSPGAFVVAKFSQDQRWYRSLVLKALEDDRVQVMFIDYGNTDTIPVTELRQVQPEFGQLIPLASRCCLLGVKPVCKGDKSWVTDAKDFLESFTENGCQCEVLNSTNSHKFVRLKVGSHDVAKKLLEMGVVASATSDSQRGDTNSFPHGIVLRKSDTVEVIVTSVDSPQSFWCQLRRNIPALFDLTNTISQHYTHNGGAAVEHAVVGQACVVRCDKSNTWYRAMLTNINPATYNVRYVDYGYVDQVSKNVVYDAESRFLKLPPQAVHCSLAMAGDLNHPEDNFTQAVLEKEFQLQVLDVLNEVTVVELFDGDKRMSDYLKRLPNVPKQVVSAVDIQPATNIPLGSTFEAFASVVISPCKFFLQKSGIDEILEDLADTLIQKYVSGSSRPPAITDPHVGQPCVALYSDDARWYRGRIIAVKGTSCDVVFVDYGNEDTVLNENIRVATPDIARVPIMAYQCCLHGGQETQWSESAVEFFESLVMDHKLDCTLVAPGSVSVSCGAHDVYSQLKDAGYCKANKSVQPSRETFHRNEVEAEISANGWQQNADSRGTAHSRRGEGRRDPKPYVEHDDRGSDRYGEGEDRRDPKPYIEHDDRGNDRYGEHKTGNNRGFYERHKTLNGASHGENSGRTSRFEGDTRTSRFEGDTRTSRFEGDTRTSRFEGDTRTSRFEGVSGRDLRSGERKNYGESKFEGSRTERKTDYASANGGGEFTYADVTSESKQSAILVHMDESGIFYIQLPSMERDILFLSKRIAGSYKGGGGPRLKEKPEKGTICCAKFSGDGNMYRAKIEDVHDNTAVLRYVDYGNTGECNVGDLKILFPDLLQYPVQAFPCTLRGYNWSLDHAEKFARATLDKDLTVTFSNATCPFEVDIMTPDGDLAGILTGVSAPQNLLPKTAEASVRSAGSGSKFQSSRVEEHSKNTCSPNSKSLTAQDTLMLPRQEFMSLSPPAGAVAAFISYVEKDGYFYLQLSKDSATIDSIAEKLLALPENIKHPNPSRGASCAAVFSEDSVWYRALIVGTKDGSLSVSFVDYGNQDLVSTSSVRPLSLELLSFPPLAFKCQFPEVGPLTPEAQARLVEYSNELEVTVTFSGTSSPFDVSVQTADGKDLLEMICPMKQYRAQSVPSDATPAGVTYIEDDGRFFLQLYQDCSALRELQDELHTICEAGAAHTIETVDIGMPCCVKLENTSWQRCQLFEATDGQAKVLLVDTGKTVATYLTSLTALPPQFLRKPPFAFECRLNGVTAWTEDMHNKFVQMTQSKILNATFYGQSPPFSVSLTRSIELDLLELASPGLGPEKSPQKQALSTCEAAADTESKGDHRAAFISYVETGGIFYIQNGDSDLMDLADRLDDLLKDNSGLSTVSVGDVVCAKFTDDDCWYRAMVESCDADKYRVRFVDFGNLDLVGRDRLAVLPESLNLSLVPAFAVKCRFFDVPGCLTSDQSDRLREAVADQALSVHFRREEDGIHEVEVSLNGVDLTNSLGLHAESPTPDLNHMAEDKDGNLDDKCEGCSPIVQTAAVGQSMDADTSSNSVLELASAEVAPTNLVSMQRASVNISYVDSPDRFYIQLEDNKAGLNQMMAAVFEHCSNLSHSVQPVDHQIGDVCAGLFEDDSWYRVKITSAAEDGTFEIFYMDYGNTEYAGPNDLHPLPVKLSQIPPWAVQAKLGGVHIPGEEWTEEALQHFKEMVEEKCLLADILQVSDDASECVVHLLSMGIPVHEELIRKGYAVAGDHVAVNKCVQQFFSDSESYNTETVTEELSVCLESTHLEGDNRTVAEEFGGCLESTHLEGDNRTAKETMMGSGAHAHQKLGCVSSSLEELQKVNVCVSHSVSPSYFWCQLSSSTNILSDISNSIATATSSLSEEDSMREALHEGDVVVAFSDDGQLYRARVLSVHPSDAGEANQQLRVRFLDYGNEGEVSQTQVFQIADSLCVWPAQAFLCCLVKGQPVGHDWSPEACLKFSEVVSDQQLLLKLVTRKQDGTALVDLVDKETGQSVHSLLEESGLVRACTTEPQSETLANSLETTKVMEASEMESLEIPQPIMESTIMVTDTTRGRTPVFTFEKAADGLFRSVRLSLHTEYDVTISNDELPNSFHVHLLELRDQYLSLMSDIADLAASDSCQQVVDFQPGDACLVEHCGVWYRGLVTVRGSTSWNVLSVDCGWVVNVSSSELKPLPDQLRELPSQAIPCYLAGIVSVDPEWPTEAISFFMDSVRTARMCIYVLETADDGKFGVYLSDLDSTGSQSVNRDMVDVGFAEVVPGSNIEVQMEMEKTLDTDMLDDLEESFNEVSLLKCNAHSTSDTQACTNIFDNPAEDYDGDCQIIQGTKAVTDSDIYNVVEIYESITSDNGKPIEPVRADEAVPVQMREFNFASAVDKIDRMGCIEDYPDEYMFAGCDSLEESVDKGNTSGRSGGHNGMEQRISDGGGLSIVDERTDCVPEQTDGGSLSIVDERTDCVSEQTDGGSLSTVDERTDCVSEQTDGGSLSTVDERTDCVSEQIDDGNKIILIEDSDRLKPGRQESQDCHSGNNGPGAAVDPSLPSFHEHTGHMPLCDGHSNMEKHLPSAKVHTSTSVDGQA